MPQDVVALIVQSVGGAIASLAKVPADANKGGHIALGKPSLLPGMRWMLSCTPGRRYRLSICSHRCLHGSRHRILGSILSGQALPPHRRPILWDIFHNRLQDKPDDIGGLFEFLLHIHPVLPASAAAPT